MYELPAGKGKRYLNKGPLSHILGGWQVNTVTSVRSGQPYNLDVVGDVANLGNQVGWFNYCSAEPGGQPAPFEPNCHRSGSTRAPSRSQLTLLGTSGRTCCGPTAVDNVDFSLFKTIPD